MQGRACSIDTNAIPTLALDAILGRDLLPLAVKNSLAHVLLETREDVHAFVFGQSDQLTH
jgi:hypothetical protein